MNHRIKKFALSLILLSLLSSCGPLALRGKKVSEQKQVSSFQKKLRKLCLTGEGKGRLRYGQNKYLFSYDMAQKKGFWGFAINSPMLGEELFQVDYKDPQKIRLSGKLFSRLRSDFRKNSPKKLRIFNQSIVALVQFLPFLSYYSQKKRKVIHPSFPKCKAKKNKQLVCFADNGELIGVYNYSSDQDFSLKRDLDQVGQTYQLSISGKNLKKFYKYIQIEIQEKGKSSSSSLFRLTLFPSSCHQEFTDPT